MPSSSEVTRACFNCCWCWKRYLLNGDGEIIKIDISPETLKEEKTILEDLIMAAHNNAKIKLKSKTSEEISKATGGLNIPGFKFPL